MHLRDIVSYTVVMIRYGASFCIPSTSLKAGDPLLPGERLVRLHSVRWKAVSPWGYQ